MFWACMHWQYNLRTPSELSTVPQSNSSSQSCYSSNMWEIKHHIRLGAMSYFYFQLVIYWYFPIWNLMQIIIIIAYSLEECFPGWNPCDSPVECRNNCPLCVQTNVPESLDLAIGRKTIWWLLNRHLFTHHGKRKALKESSVDILSILYYRKGVPNSLLIILTLGLSIWSFVSVLPLRQLQLEKHPHWLWRFLVETLPELTLATHTPVLFLVHQQGCVVATEDMQTLRPLCCIVSPPIPAKVA